MDAGVDIYFSLFHTHGDFPLLIVLPFCLCQRSVGQICVFLFLHSVLLISFGLLSQCLCVCTCVCLHAYMCICVCVSHVHMCVCMCGYGGQRLRSVPLLMPVCLIFLRWVSYRIWGYGFSWTDWLMSYQDLPISKPPSTLPSTCVTGAHYRWVLNSGP